jgi:acyl-CoA reductase-like NAD-dependent aldehyde dehydrogenase
MDALADGILEHATELENLMVDEVGKPRIEARGEVSRAVAVVRYYAQAALDAFGEEYPSPDGQTRIHATRHPLGVVAAICPWNFPLAIPLWKTAPAIAWGNAAVIKPAGEAVAVAQVLGEIAGEALPDGVLQVIPLPGARASELLGDDRVRGVTFTGSTEVGMKLIESCASRGVPIQAEMGGQNPAVVLADANIDHAAKLIASGAMGYAGQKCTATRRAIVVEEAAEELTQALVREVEALVVGDPADEQTVVGPLINPSAVEDFEQAIQRALENGATELARGEKPDSEGLFVSPALLGNDDPEAEVNQEETFGPLLTVIKASDAEHAIEIANSTRYGLSGAVHTSDLVLGEELASRLECGMQRVNYATAGVDYWAPFGGEGFSSYGPREQGRAAREHFTAYRTISISPSKT